MNFKSTFISILIFLYSTHASIAYSQEVHPLRIQNEQHQFRYGLLDAKGDWVMPPDYVYMSQPVRNRLVVKDSSQFALFTTQGQQLTAFKYPYFELKMSDYLNDFLVVRTEHHYGAIDTNGKELLPPIYELLGFEYLRNCVKAKTQGKYTLLDSNFHEILPAEFDDIDATYPHFINVQKNAMRGIYSYSGNQIGSIWYEADNILLKEQYMPVKINGKWGALDTKTGSMHIDPMYEELSSNFVTPGEPNFFYWENGLMGLADSNGKHITGPIYQDERVEYYSHLIGVMKDSLWGAVDEQGKEIIPCIYDAIDLGELNFNEGRVCVKKNGLIGFLDVTGKEIFSPQFTESYYGLVCKNGKWGYLDENDKFSIPCNYDTLFWINTTIGARKNKKYGLLNTSGKIIIPFMYDLIESPNGEFSGTDFVRVGKKNKYGLITNKGKMIIPVTYPYLTVLQNKVIVYNYKPCFDCDGVIYFTDKPTLRNIGVATMEGKLISPIQYDEVEHIYSNGSFILRYNDEYTFFDQNGKEKPIR